MKTKLYYYYIRIISKIISPLSLLGSIITLRDVDTSNRYRNVLKMINNNDNIIEIGSQGYSPLAQFNNKVVLIDLKYRPGINIIASASCLPFRSNTFDIVVSIDVVEHIPRSIRETAIREMMRISRKRVIIHAPLEDGKRFVGRIYDKLFNDWYIQKHGIYNVYTLEHIKYIEPSPNEIASLDFVINGTHNAKLWLNYMKIRYRSNSPFLLIPMIFMANFYYILNSNKDNIPPFWGGLCIYEKKLDRKEILKNKN